MDIHSTIEFQSIIGEAVTNAIHDVIDECEQMVKEHVQSDVYGVGGSDWYQRTNELLDAWQTAKGHLMAELKEDTGAISCNPDMWQHGSNIGGGTDVSEYILHMMNDGFYDALNWGGGAARPFWDNFIKEFDSKGRMIIKKALRAQGLPVR